MTREIKFRAWNTDHIKPQMEYITIQTAMFSSDSFRLYDKEIMQYVGIEDTKGVEIYEGDIIRFSEYGSYKYECIEDMVEWLQDYSLGEEECGQYDEIYVIGNKYDNPELMKEVE